MMVQDNVIEGSLKYRDGKKWKLRWAVLSRLSPVADVLQLLLYRDSRDCAKGLQSKASLALKNSLALNVGFTLDKESHTLSLICSDLSLILAFDSRERLLQWHTKISTTLGHEEQFLVQVAHTPPKSRIPLGPAKIHIRNHRICLTTGSPPRAIEAWALIDLRRYGVVDGRFVWEGGNQSGRGAGVHVSLSDEANAITKAIDLASRGVLVAKHRQQNEHPPSVNTIHRDASQWLRDIGALNNCCQYSEFGETLSILTTDEGGILSPRSDYSLKHHCCDSRDCSFEISGSNSSSNGSIIEGDRGWCSNTWSGYKGNLWDIGHEMAPESLYDTPRSFLQANAKHFNETFSFERLSCGSVIHCSPKFNSKKFGQLLNSTPNPMDNYDIPKLHSKLYDVPKRVASCSNKGTFPHLIKSSYGPASFIGSDSSKDFGKLKCNEDQEACNPNNEGSCCKRNLVINGGEEIAHLCIPDNNLDPSFYSFSQCINHINETRATKMGYKPTASVATQNELNGETRPEIGDVELTDPIYAVVNKRRERNRPNQASPTPPTSWTYEDKTPTNPNPSYAAMFCRAGCLEINGACDGSTKSCGNCNPLNLLNHSTTDENNHVSVNGRINVVKPAIRNENNDGGDAEYSVTTPEIFNCEEESPYLYMKSVYCSLPKTKRPFLRSRRSLSLAKNECIPNETIRRATSADSVLQYPAGFSGMLTPNHTPCSSPTHSSSTAPYKISESCSEATTCNRGRSRSRKAHNSRHVRHNSCISSSCHYKIFNSDIPENQKSNIPTESLQNGICSDDFSKLQLSRVKNKNEECYAFSNGTPIPVNQFHQSIGQSVNQSISQSVIISSKREGCRDSLSSCDSGVSNSPRSSDHRIQLTYHHSLPRGLKDARQVATTTNGQIKDGWIQGRMRDVSLGDFKSSSSGASDVSDSLDALSLSSHSSSGVLVGASVSTLRPRSGKEYSRIDRSAIDLSMQVSLGEVSSLSKYSSSEKK